FVGLEPVAEPGADADEHPGDSPELAAARRRHPSHPDFVPNPPPVPNDHERTVATLEELAATQVELADVRPGLQGTLDVYVFADGTTLYMTPGDRETADRLATALRSGETPFLLGGSGIAGAYTLTLSCGEVNVSVLADRIIACHRRPGRPAGRRFTPDAPLNAAGSGGFLLRCAVPGRVPVLPARHRLTQPVWLPWRRCSPRSRPGR